MVSLTKSKQELRKYSRPDRVADYQRFFKTGKGEYGEGDKFLGVMIPNIRKAAKFAKDLSFSDITKLLKSPWHEERLMALLILVHIFETQEERQKEIYDFYLSNTKYINNWDLVDVTTPKIVGAYLLERPKERKILYRLAKSKDLWEKRISILATFAFIYNGESKDTLAIAEILLNDKHDLIHKAVGWMLREVGKRVSQKKEEKFLKKHYKKMPRTMLRYAIERFEEKKRKYYMRK